MENKFYVGQEVLCVKSHPKGAVRRGEKFEVIGIKRSSCKRCNNILLDVGIKTHNRAGMECHGFDILTNGEWWLASERFIPIDNTLSEITADEIIEELETVNA